MSTEGLQSATGSRITIAPAPSQCSFDNLMANPSSSTTMLPTQPATIGPTKNWVVPPRPRPGRKPATDTPPTRRKAQNRAAQRAFRERRAARVGELEEQLKETEEERQKRENEMHDQIQQQEATISKLLEEVQRLSSENSDLRLRYVDLGHRSEIDKQAKDDALTEVMFLRNGSRTTGTNAVPLPPRRHRELPRQEIDDSSHTTVGTLGCGNCTLTGSCVCVEATMSIVTSGCGDCSGTDHCECLQASFEPSRREDVSVLQGAMAQSTTGSATNISLSRDLNNESDMMEVDFTAQFIKRPLVERDFQEQTSISQTGGDSCGFCADGTFCACATAGGPTYNVADEENRLAPLLHEVTPPPSENEVASSDTTANKLLLLHPNHRRHHAIPATRTAPVLPDLHIETNSGGQTGDSCSGVPGSCRQCQQNPRSGLLCRSLAAIRASNSQSQTYSADCCGKGSNSGGCCREQTSSQPKLSCAEAFKTIASHKDFDRASDEIGIWLPKLQATSGRYPGRAPLDIEAASVMNVIKYFDVRFGRN